MELENKKAARLLVVDDSPDNREVLSRRLSKQGYEVELAEDGQQALEILRTSEFDLVLLDVMMPRMDGPHALQIMKADFALRHIPVIMISALDEIDTIVRCIELGAEDYLHKPFDPVLLRARIHACLEKKRLRDLEMKNQKQISAQLTEAATYVRSLLPAPLEGDVSTEWRFIPSTELGGDSFGYHWLDPDHLAIYLLDVTGHGVGPALLSVSVINVLRSRALPETDFYDPAGVLSALNKAFPRESQNNKLFSLWYGVFNKSRRVLTYASGGHPPAVLLSSGDSEKLNVAQLLTRGLLIGCFPGAIYTNSDCEVRNGSKLYVYSDGAYEITRLDGEIMELEEFIEILRNSQRPGEKTLDQIISRLKQINGSDSFPDDLSLLQVTF